MVHGLRCCTACGIFLDQGSNPCLLHWQADSLPLSHQGSPPTFYFILLIFGCAGSLLLCGLLPSCLIGGLSLVGVCRLPIAVASLAVEHRPVLASVAAAPRLWRTGAVTLSHGLSCSESCRIFPDQGSNLCLLHWQAYSSLWSQGSPTPTLFWCIVLFCFCFFSWRLITLQYCSGFCQTLK